MSAAATTADPTGSTAVDSTGSSTPQDVGGEGENHEDTPEVEVVDGSKGEGVPVIKPALIYTKQGEVVEVDQKIVEAVDGFRVPDGFVRKGSREQSYMYSLGVYCEEREGVNHKYFCLAGSEGRRAKRAIPCKKGDRSNVNTHLKAKHDMQETSGVKKDAKKQEAQEGIKACSDASRNSGVGTNSWIPGMYCLGGDKKAGRCSHTSHQLRSRCLGTRRVPRRSSATSVVAVFSSCPTGAALTHIGWRW